MNFFVFNTSTNSIKIAGDFWVFIVTWLPLTFVTGFIYWIWYCYSSENRHKNEKGGKKQDLFHIRRNYPSERVRGSGIIV
jgi:hypothetical protein